MAFCTFSREMDENSFTFIENKFILKYLPEANDFAVKVYLYGLYLCGRGGDEFSAQSMAEVLHTTPQKITDAFEYWQDYDVVEILCKDPLTVQYLPIRAASGRPKKIRYDKYADFNKELQKSMQKVGKFINYNDSVKYMNFLEEHNIQPMALLLIVEYYITKQGDKISSYHIFNKAKKLILDGYTTYEQVERVLGNYNEHEKELLTLFSTLSISRKVDESDYLLYQGWLEKGFDKSSIKAAAKHMKKGSMNALSLLLEELAEKGKFSSTDVEHYLLARDTLSNLTFRIARKLGVKVSNPVGYIDEYVEKWVNFGFDETSLLDIALFCLKTNRGDFASMHEQAKAMFKEGVVSRDSVKDYFKTKNADLKLLTKMQEYCGGLRVSTSNLALITTWREWNFSDEMILEAAKRSASSASPVPYMNKILSEWKRAGYTTVQDLEKEEKSAPRPVVPTYQNASVEAANAKSDRDKYYAERRERAMSVADKFMAKANANARFKQISSQLSTMELQLAKAELYDPASLPALQQQQAALKNERAAILQSLGIAEWQLLPQFTCKKCQDTGFLENGVSCDCYQK